MTSLADTSAGSARTGDAPALMVELDRVTTSLGGHTVMRDISLQIERGEFFSIIGPSGCGKTTTLRTLGGFLLPDEGVVRLDGRDVTTVPPNKREVNTVFQSYALFSHLTLAKNIAYGLKNKHLPAEEIRKRVGDALELVGMTARAHHKPGDLSGGQRQRIALARALVNLPKLLLLDEPLGALDLNLRRQMQDELKRIHREVGVCFVYVTHDQEEALSMSDRVAVMSEGRVEQIATPRDLYESPVSTFVASFVGGSNVFRSGADASGPAVTVKPERIALFQDDVPAELEGRIRGRIVECSYLGAEVHYTVATESDGEIKVRRPAEFDAPLAELARGTDVTLAWHPSFGVAVTR